MMKTKLSANMYRFAVYTSAIITIAVLVFIVGYILVKGIPNITSDLFSPEYSSENVSLMPALINTVAVTGMSLLIAVPVGIFSAVYLTEYAKRGNKFVKIIRMMSETLSGIPSIVYGLFGMLFFVNTMNMGLSLLAGSLTLVIMILPTIMRTSEEALLSVPDNFREGSFGLGAGGLRTVMKIVLPSAIPGILSGIILATGRIVGETAALIYTAGTLPEMPEGVFDSVRTLSVHMYTLSQEGLYIDQTYATAVILIIIVVGINALAAFAARRFARKNG